MTPNEPIVMNTVIIILRKKQIWFGKNNFVLIRLVLKFKLVNENSLVTLWTNPWFSHRRMSHWRKTKQITSTVAQTPASSRTFIRKAIGRSTPSRGYWHHLTQQHLDMKGSSESRKTLAAKGTLILLLQMWDCAGSSSWYI